MRARFKLEPRINVVSGNARNHLFVTTEFGFMRRDDFDLPALPFGVTHIHAEQAAGEQRGFVAARSGADFEEDVALVVGVFGKQQLLQFVLDFRQACPCGVDFFFGEVFHLRVGEHSLCRAQVGLALLPGFVQGNDRDQLGVFACEFAILLHIPRGFGVGKNTLQFVQTANKVFQFVADALFHLA